MQRQPLLFVKKRTGRHAQVMNHHISPRGRILHSRISSCEEIIHTFRSATSTLDLVAATASGGVNICVNTAIRVLYRLYLLYGTYIIVFHHNLCESQLNSHHCSHRSELRHSASWVHRSILAVNNM